MEMENGNQMSEQVPTSRSSVVANVQEMVRRSTSYVPENYITNQDDRPNCSPVSSDVPVIDLSLLDGRNEEELKKLDLACKHWGFFQVTNHGVAEEILNNMKDTTSSFFKLPFEDKKKKLEYWPTNPPKLKDAIETYSSEVNRVAKSLLGHLSLSMGMEKEALLAMHKEVMQSLRVNYYPTCSMPDRVLGASLHSDTSSITILMQDDDITGLHIRHDGGAVTNKTTARISSASFIMPYHDVEIEPLDQMVDPQNPLKIYKKIKYGDYLKESLKEKLEGKAHTMKAKLETV
ncbi:hypothetical protein IFM89_003779 [Coptis chinensis]|uniref:Fe2OG dioxygenase domain-containing protein n=1 Tax=Coptis chinensis TaxID=261450 RepID=A0A835I9F8_9MAGN|nr:hypothetical protein IFM89_003779 [Coptis chinensis]